MRYLFLALALSCSASHLATASLRAEPHTHEIADEVCQARGSDGEPCKGRVTRGESSSSGVWYTCSNGHKFFVKAKVRIK